MRKSLRSGTEDFEILDREDAVVEFDSVTAARSFLRRFEGDAAQMQVLRTLLASGRPDLHRMKDKELLDKVAETLVSQRVRLLRRRSYRHAVEIEGTEVAEQEQKSEKAATPTPVEKSWIEIQLVDMDGQPVPNEKYRIKLPDGSIEEGRLDGFGYAEYYGINRGTCQVSFIDLDGDSWEIL